MEYTESLADFASGIVTDAVLADGTLSHLKYLERYCRLEGCDYGTLVEGLGVLVDALRAYRRKKSKVSLKLAKHQAGLCGLPEEFVDSLADMPAPQTDQATPASGQPYYYYNSYVRGRSGGIFDEMPGGKNLEKKETIQDMYAWRKFVKAVDLGLPSGTKWASCNLGATEPEEFGDYYAWGEIETKDGNYDWHTYSLCKGNQSSCLDTGLHISGTPYDPAHMKWGDGWKMPTSTQFKELLKNCSYQWTTVNGKKGGLFTSRKNGNSIFLPACEQRIGWRRHCSEDHGCYWAGTRYQKKDAYYIWFASTRVIFEYFDRCYGLCIRPVLK